jgi:opacity protein-like surface antigen
MVFPKTTTITIRETIPVPDRRRWGIGIQAGAGVGKEGLTPYVGVGVSYNILSW